MYSNTIYHDELPQRAVAVFLYLRGRQGRNACAWPSIKTIALDLKMSRSTVKRAISDLVRAGYVEVEYRRRDNGSKTASKYYLKEPKNKWQ